MTNSPKRNTYNAVSPATFAHAFDRLGDDMDGVIDEIAKSPYAARASADGNTMRSMGQADVDAVTCATPFANASTPKEGRSIGKVDERPVRQRASWAPSPRDRMEGIIAWSLLGAVTCAMFWIACWAAAVFFYHPPH